MDYLEKRIRMAAESILENEALREGAPEEVAHLLIHWGVIQAENLARQTVDIEDEEEADQAIYPRMKALRQVMLVLKDLAVTSAWSEETLAQALTTATHHARTLYGETWQPPTNLEEQIKQSLHEDQAQIRMRALLDLFSQGSTTTQTASPDSPPPQASDTRPRRPGWFARLFRKLWE